MPLLRNLITLILTCLLLAACTTFEVGVERTPTASTTTRTIGQTPIAASTSSTETISTANWKTYTNPKYGFSFKYPPTMSIQKGPAADYPDEAFDTANAIFFEGPLIPNDKASGMTFAILTPEAVDPAINCTDDQSCLKQYIASAPEPIYARLQTTVLGRSLEGLEYYVSNPLYAVVTWKFVFADQGRMWLVYVYINLKSGETYDPYDRLRAFEQILATLELFDGSAGK